MLRKELKGEKLCFSDPDTHKEPVNWFWKGFAYNALVALAILTAVALGCEGWVRRKGKKIPV